MLKFLLPRLLLAALPFVVYFLWRANAVRAGRPIPKTPYGWIVGAGALLIALSLLVSVAFQNRHLGQTYVPAQTLPNGEVKPGHFE